MRKVDSFTLLEVVISMLLAGVVTAFTYAGLQFYMKIFSQQRENSRSTVELASFTKALTKDFDSAEIVYFNGEGIDCIYSDKEISYNDRGEYILRRAEQTDTFKLVSFGIKCYFEKEEADYAGTVVDHLDWSLLAEEEPIRVVRQKNYAADFFYNFNRNGR